MTIGVYLNNSLILINNIFIFSHLLEQISSLWDKTGEPKSLTQYLKHLRRL